MTNPSIDSGGPAVYLCQVSPAVSCGACCGLYNIADASAGNIEAVLYRRTAAFARVGRSVDDIYGFQQAIASIEDQNRPFREFHHCPFIGLIGRNRSRADSSTASSHEATRLADRSGTACRHRVRW